MTCVRCGHIQEVHSNNGIRNDNTIGLCVLCGCGYFYREKDFNAPLGFAIMSAAVAGFLWFQSTDIVIALGILIGAAALDFLAYFSFPNRTICYRCLAMYRGCIDNPEHGRYELGLAGRFTEDYERERHRARESGGPTAGI